MRHANPWCLASVILLAAGLSLPAWPQMVAGLDMPGFDQALGLPKTKPATDYTAQFLASSAPGNILWPGEQASFTFQVVNATQQPLVVHGKVDLIAYGTRGRPGDIWVPEVFRIAACGSEPVSVDLKAGGFQNLTVSPKTPERYGAYALVLDLGERGRRFVTSFVRTFKPTPGKVVYPQLALDVIYIPVLTRLGAFPNRIGIGYKPTTDQDFEQWFAEQGAKLDAYRRANLPITLEIGGGAYNVPEQPLGRPRPWLDDKGVMMDTKFDLAWLPSYDDDFRKFVKLFVSRYGWPKGPINGIKLWNEPWEGISISGWGADMPRYREIFRALCEATDEARREAGVQVLIGGCDSSSNTFDKLFGDGNDEFLKYLDFCSIHYQGMSPPSTIKAWVNRQSPNGRVRIWDTESWVANVDDRVAAVIATNLSTGHDRAVGIYHGNICTDQYSTGVDILGDDGHRKHVDVVQTWPVAASVGAANHFLGERRFREMLFRNGLPWVMVFDGLPGSDGKPNPEDGTVVVVGDIGEEFGADNVMFRTARGFREMAHKAQLRKEIAALPADADPKRRAELEAALRAEEPLSGGTMALKSGGGRLGLYDFYGNAVPAEHGEIVVPLDHRGFFLRGNGQKGSFAALLEALRASRVEGIEPLATVCHDMTAPIADKPSLHLSLTNVLNRPVSGRLQVRLGDLKLQAPGTLNFKANETEEVVARVVGGEAVASNTYHLALAFDAGRDGRVEHEEDLHVNLIARRTIQVDGQLDDWEGVLPQVITAPDTSAPTLTEAAWFPFKSFGSAVNKGFATGYLACDDRFFYFAARIADDTPDEGMVRFETRDDDEYFYPEKSYAKKDGGLDELIWPAGVRRYSYRKDPELPAGNFPNHDNVQIAFNVLPAEAKPWYPCPPGTMPGYTGYYDTDYEYALNPVAPRYGGGVEVWRLRCPGMPHKHFYPRQGKSPYDGPVRDAKLVVRRDGNERIVEAAIPWSEIPAVKQRVDAGLTIKFSFRVNDNAGGGCMELSRGRSVAKRNGSFLVDWVEHWANELEFGVAPGRTG